MRFRVLGPLQVRQPGGWSTVRGAQARAVLAILLTESGRVVGADRLVEEIWGDHPPKTALNTIQGYVGRLRRLLDGDEEARLLTRDHGYQLAVAEEQLDSSIFEHLVDSGQRQLQSGQTADGAEALAAALALWRGPALSDVPASPAVTGEASRLEQRRLTALEAQLGAQLALGRHAETVDELHRLVAEQPLREQLRCHLIMALYRCGRRAEALDVYRQGRVLLVGELGMEPGPELRELERAVLADDPRLAIAEIPAAPTLGRVTPAQLPADVVGFTGREVVLRQLDDLLPPRDGASSAVVIATIVGAPGVGKTALAVHWAHRVRDRFADGQLYVNLHGHAPGPPIRPIDALARFLHALGLPAEQVPTDVEEAAGLYRSLLADQHVLVLLDNAHNPDQVRPLLPGAPGCLVLVTSRNAMRGLVARDGARELPLDVLTAPESRALLTGLLGAGRTSEEPAAVADLASLCTHLPLALRIAGANLTAGPHQNIAGYTDLLRGDRLAMLQVDGDEQAAVRATFGLSYAALPEDVRRLFRLLGSMPGPDISVAGVAALAATTQDGVRRSLARLAEAHLIIQHATDRYGFHDLLRLYASERGDAEDDERERASAVRRLYDWYLRTVDAAATLLYPQMRRLQSASTRAAFTDHTSALSWLDDERQNLVAAITQPSPYRPLPVVATLADALRGYFWLRMYTVDWLAVAQAGLTAAEACGDLRAQAAALLSIADAHFRQGQYQRAIDYSTRALTVSREGGWPPGEAAAHNNLGNLQRESGELSHAVEHHQRALAINRRAGTLAAQVNNLGNLGVVYRNLGNLCDALDTHTEALAIARKIVSSHSVAVNIGAIGAITHDLGQLDAALDYLRQALRASKEIGDRGGEVDARNELAGVHRDACRYRQALDHADAALALARDTTYRHGEINVRNTVGTIRRRLGHRDGAVDQHRQALTLARQTGYRYGETQALIGLAATEHDLADAETAIGLSSSLGYRVLEGQARNVAAAIQFDRDRINAATDLANQALAIHRATGHRLGEACALIILGQFADHTGHRDRASAHRANAYALLADIGARWTDDAVVARPMAET